MKNLYSFHFNAFCENRLVFLNKGADDQKVPENIPNTPSIDQQEGQEDIGDILAREAKVLEALSQLSPAPAAEAPVLEPDTSELALEAIPKPKPKNLADFVRALYETHLADTYEGVMPESDWEPVKQLLDRVWTPEQQNKLFSQLNRLNPYFLSGFSMELFRLIRELQNLDQQQTYSQKQQIELKTKKESLIAEMARVTQGIFAVRKGGENVKIGGHKISELNKNEIEKAAVDELVRLRDQLNKVGPAIQEATAQAKTLRDPKTANPEKEIPELTARLQDLLKTIKKYEAGKAALQQGKTIIFEGEKMTAQNRAVIENKINRKFESLLRDYRATELRLNGLKALQQLPKLNSIRSKIIARGNNVMGGLRALRSGKDVQFEGKRVTSLNAQEAEKLLSQRYAELTRSFNGLQAREKQLAVSKTQDNQARQEIRNQKMKDLLALLPKMIDYQPNPANLLGYKMKEALSEQTLSARDMLQATTEGKALETLVKQADLPLEVLDQLLQRQNQLYENDSTAARVHNRELMNLVNASKSESRPLIQLALQEFINKKDSYFYQLSSLEKHVRFAESKIPFLKMDLSISEELLNRDQTFLNEMKNRKDLDPEQQQSVAQIKAFLPLRRRAVEDAQAQLDQAGMKIEEARAELALFDSTNSAIAVARTSKETLSKNPKK